MTDSQAAPPWRALFSLIFGFFMIMIDTTIVSNANPRIMESVHADLSSVVWVTSSYLLAYAVPLLVTGRLGDRFGPRNIYIAGLVVFTLASVACGLSSTIGELIAFRAVQGLGAALVTPQSMAVITRIFPRDKRGTAMGIWGSVAGAATLVGPILGGFLVGTVGWEWIFFINVPIGTVGVILALRYVPRLELRSPRFDVLGIILSSAGMFCIVFGVQEGQNFHWGTISGPITVWSIIITGLVIMTAFLIWQRFNKAEPLLPLRLYGDRNFSISSAAVAGVGGAIAGLGIPIGFYYQIGRGFEPLQAALMMLPLAVVSGVLGPFVGRLTDRISPRTVALLGLAFLTVGIALYGFLLRPDTPIPILLLPPTLIGIGSSAVWAPLSVSATRNLPMDLAGAGAGAYNATRQVGSVLGTAAISALVQSRLVANLSQLGDSNPSAITAPLPANTVSGYASAMSEGLILPVSGLLCVIVLTAFLKRPGRPARLAQTAATAPAALPVGSKQL